MTSFHASSYPLLAIHLLIIRDGQSRINLYSQLINHLVLTFLLVLFMILLSMTFHSSIVLSSSYGFHNNTSTIICIIPIIILTNTSNMTKLIISHIVIFPRYLSCIKMLLFMSLISINGCPFLRSFLSNVIMNLSNPHII